MHTVFSDGLVWPTVRVREAVNDGLDAIAISEHLEYWSHKKYLKADHNASYEIAKPYADKKDLILIKAAEITKAMPPGHFNFLFIKDANTIDSVDWKKAIIQANEQGAFVFWNHPGWRQEDEIPIWYDEHSWVLSQGLIQGIEVVNENSYYPLAHQWAIDSNLTLLGNSDIHDPIDLFFDRSKDEHRPLTLVFAKERSEEGIREALDSKRTAIYYKDMLIGNEVYLKEMFYSSVSITESMHEPIWIFSNSSSVPFKLAYLTESGSEFETAFIRNGESIQIEIPESDPVQKWSVKNFIIAPGKCLEFVDIMLN